jgi:hypothetical protein
MPKRIGQSLTTIWRESEQVGIFSGTDRIDLLMVATGHKDAMRANVNSQTWPQVRDFVGRHNLAIAWREKCVLNVLDHGKGGWSNLLADHDHPSGRKREMLVYIARENRHAQNALAADENDDAAFGALLGYPECCRAAFERMFPVSLQHQGDLVPLVADQTPMPQPWPFFLNIAARYFNKSLISFYPCSFGCEAALSIARQAYALLKHVSPEGAADFTEQLSSSILYTEYRGIYLFPGSRWTGSDLHYKNVQMTARNLLGKQLLRGDRLKPMAPAYIEIAAGDRLLGKVCGTNIRLLVFGDNG